MKSFFKGLFRQKNIKYFVGAGILLIFGAVYLWYAHNYGNKEQVSLEAQSRVDYDEQNSASKYNLTADYIWSRTKSVMLVSDKLIPEYYMIQGQLTEEKPEFASRYSLTDQALLLSVYVRQNDRLSAMSLVDEVYDRFATSQGSLLASEADADKQNVSVHDNIVWLESFLEYYSVFGSTSDYERIKNASNSLFDEEGNIVESEISFATLQSIYVENGDGTTALVEEERTESDVNLPNNNTVKADKIDGVEMRSVNLRLIRNLENNKFIPAGSYDKALKIVKESFISEDVPFYAYAYQINEDGTIHYIFEGNESGAVDISASIETALNMADVGELSPAVFAYLKSAVVNQKNLGNLYYIATKQASGSVNLFSYIQCLNIAIDCDDTSMYETLCEIIGGKVATYNNSPILSMIYRNDEYRFTAYAQDNLLIYLLLT